VAHRPGTPTQSAGVSPPHACPVYVHFYACMTERVRLCARIAEAGQAGGVRHSVRHRAAAAGGTAGPQRRRRRCAAGRVRAAVPGAGRVHERGQGLVRQVQLRGNSVAQTTVRSYSGGTGCALHLCSLWGVCVRARACGDGVCAYVGGVDHRCCWGSLGRGGGSWRYRDADTTDGSLLLCTPGTCPSSRTPTEDCGGKRSGRR
jgi:hypothetical protein